ncbi:MULTISPECIES: hypothetical protein [unclassified Bradyrhizobium]|uniref:hypothetical protein n=1 Tax=unclassified Bradyrhizobium TaxID=2631580 RepID=UPI00291654B0|nr:MULTISPECIES: hypothetical protein [unclassified Bradyrhizobium]
MHTSRSSASNLLNDEAAFDGDVVEAQLVRDPGKSAGGAAGWRGKGAKNKIHRIYSRAAYWDESVRSMEHWSESSRQPARPPFCSVNLAVQLSLVSTLGGEA